MDKVLDLVPDVTGLLDKLSERAEQVNKVGEDLTKDIEALRENIGLARGEASRVLKLFLSLYYPYHDFYTVCRSDRHSILMRASVTAFWE